MAERGLGDEVARRLWPASDPHFADPVGWIKARIGPMWSAQEEIAKAITEHRRVAVATGHGVGKDWTAAALAAWWTASRSDSFLVTSAPTSAQLGGVLWRELGRHHTRAELRGTITAGQIPTWRIGGELRGWGRKPADMADPEQAAAAFSGIHARYVFTILDEASGIPDWLWDAAETLMTSDASRLLAIGNPLDPSSRFARVCAPGSGWHVIEVSVFDTPAFTKEKVSPELLDVLPSQRWVEERRRDWGEGSPQWIARVEGRFPPSSPDTLIQPAWIAAAQERDLAEQGAAALGVDVARSGSDKTVIAASWPTGRVRIVHEAAGADTMATAGEVMRLLAERFPDALAAVDVVGIGAGVFDRLIEQDANAIAFSSASRAHESTRFANRRAEAFWRLREALEEGKVDLDPLDLELAAQLGALKWKVDSSGRILIESKDAIRARGLPSPDRADAMAMAFDRPSVASPVFAQTSDRLADFRVPTETAVRPDETTEEWLSGTPERIDPGLEDVSRW